MGKLSEIFGRNDDDTDEAPDSQSDVTTAAGEQTEGDAEHPPAAMPADAPAVAVPGDAPPAYSSIQEYEESLPAPDFASPAPQQDA
jgi:hypothetical protein